MKHSSSLFVALVALAVALGGFAAPARAFSSETFTGTVSPDDPYHDYVVYLNAGDTIIIEVDCPDGTPIDPYLEVYDSDGNLLDFDDDDDTLCDRYGSLLVFTAPAAGEYTIRVTDFIYAETGDPVCGDGIEGICFGDYILTITGEFTWPGEEPSISEPAEAPSASPSCRPIRLPRDSVVGAFVTETVADWSPGKATASPPVVFTPGKAVWVIGVNEDATHYKIAYVCNYLWVPVSSLGPNYDAMWNGTPLPTRTVK
ncbi:MAG: DVUA0089 family protein [Anaerolineae bacterium]|nr:DVUA0089 family protein [Anaerolineae bacterium]